MGGISVRNPFDENKQVVPDDRWKFEIFVCMHLLFLILALITMPTFEVK